ncbi:MAG TPA: hypothetical protein VFE10_04155 [Phenylobacterium sp.]|jgi:hypothetical protein|nr:hypothetical protein [Phenylobacterium sp.]
MRPTTIAEALKILVALRDQTAATSPNKQLEFVNFCLANLLRSRSQFLQDLWVAYELGSRKNGHFVEFGGADGIKAATAVSWNGSSAGTGSSPSRRGFGKRR